VHPLSGCRQPRRSVALTLGHCRSECESMSAAHGRQRGCNRWHSRGAPKGLPVVVRWVCRCRLLGGLESCH
jgi:hypothetical protein